MYDTIESGSCIDALYRSYLYRNSPDVYHVRHYKPNAIYISYVLDSIE